MYIRHKEFCMVLKKKLKLQLGVVCQRIDVGSKRYVRVEAVLNTNLVYIRYRWQMWRPVDSMSQATTIIHYIHVLECREPAHTRTYARWDNWFTRRIIFKKKTKKPRRCSFETKEISSNPVLFIVKIYNILLYLHFGWNFHDIDVDRRRLYFELDILIKDSYTSTSFNVVGFCVLCFGITRSHELC